MNIVINYTKQGADCIDLKIKLHYNEDVWYKQNYSIINSGKIEFYCDWPFNTLAFLDFESIDLRIKNNKIEITSFVFDDFWNIVNVFRGENLYSTDYILDNGAGLKYNVIDNNILFFSGKLRYKLPPRPICNWLIG